MLISKLISVKKVFLFSVFSLTLLSCGTDLIDYSKEKTTTESTVKDVDLELFSTILSKVVHQRRDVRVFLK